MRRLLEDDEQRDYDERRDNRQLVIIDVGNDLRLPYDDDTSRRTSRGGNQIPELYDYQILEQVVDGGDVLRDGGVINLRVLCPQAVHRRDADARADVAQ